MRNFVKRNSPVFVVGLITLVIFLIIIGASQKKQTQTPDLQEISESELIAPHTYVRGMPSAPVALVVFCSFSEQECADYYPYVNGLYEQYKTYLKIAFRHFAPDDKLAAAAAQIAGEQNKFWEYVEILFNNMGVEKTSEALIDYANILRLDNQEFQEALEGGDFESLVDTDTRFAQKSGIEKVPTFFLNGQKMEFSSPQDFKDQVGNKVKEYMSQTVNISDNEDIVKDSTSSSKSIDQVMSQRFTPYEIELSKQTLEIKFTNKGWDPQITEAYPNQLVRWTNESTQTVKLAQLDKKFPELKGGVEIQPGASFEFRLYGDRLWRYIDTYTKNWAEIFILY